MADQKLTDLPAIATGDIDNSVLLYCVDVTGGNISSKVTRSALYLDIANTFTKGQTISSVLLTGLVINPPTTPLGSASVTFIGGLNLTTGTIAFATTAQSTDYGTARINQATLVNSPGSGVIPNAWSLKIDGPPIASTQVTISNNYSLWIASGGTYLQGTLTINTGSSPLVIYNPAGTFAYTLTPGAIVANRQLNIPLTTATDTLAVLGLAQTFSGAITSTGGITMSSADITLAGNKIKTTTYQTFETATLINPILYTSPQSGNNPMNVGISPSGTSRSSQFHFFRTSDVVTNYERMFIGSDLGVVGEFGIYVDKGNSGSLRPFNVYMSGTKLLSFDTANTITHYVNTNIGLNAILATDYQLSEVSDFVSSQTWNIQNRNNGGNTLFTLNPPASSTVAYMTIYKTNDINTNYEAMSFGTDVTDAVNFGIDIRKGGTGTLRNWVLRMAGTQSLLATPLLSIVIGKSAIATNATDGFPYIPANAGAPTGVPTAQTGFVAMYYDTTNHKIWFYDTNTSTWRGVAVT